MSSGELSLVYTVCSLDIGFVLEYLCNGTKYTRDVTPIDYKCLEMTVNFHFLVWMVKVKTMN